jgi:hypothetical protein
LFCIKASLIEIFGGKGEMIIIPREKPVIENLNSYYLNINKLVEHYQGELGAGVVYFKSSSMECVLFFDEYQVVNGCCEKKSKKLVGPEAIERTLKMASRNNFFVSVFWIPPDQLHFWANLSDSKIIYSDLATEFTDLEGLIRKMEGEKLTGYIDVHLNGDYKGGLLFFFNGEIIGGLAAEDAISIDRSIMYRDELIARSREFGGKFNVSRIFLDGGKRKNEPSEAVSVSRPKKTKPPQPVAVSEKATDSGNVLEMLESLLNTMDRVVRSDRKNRYDLETLLNRKFVEKVDKYDFLDPFAAEFRYSGGSISYSGDAGDEALVQAIAECVTEIAGNLGISPDLRSELHSWRKEFANEVITYDLRL